MAAVMLAAMVGLAPVEPVQVGQVAPPVVALTAGGDFGVDSYFRGKSVLLSFWSLKDAASLRQFEQLRQIRREMAREKRLLIIDVCVDEGETDHETWLAFLNLQGKPDYGDRDGRSPVPFYSDSQWINTIQGGSDFVSTRAYGVERLPEAYLIGPDRRVRAARIPTDQLSQVVTDALRRSP